MSLKIWTTVFTWLNIALIIFIGVFLIKLFQALNKYLKQTKHHSQQQYTTIGDVLKEYRIKNNMTQEFVAQKLGVSRQAVSKWENGTNTPSTSNLLAIARLYNVPAQEILSQIKPQ